MHDDAADNMPSNEEKSLIVVIGSGEKEMNDETSLIMKTYNFSFILIWCSATFE